jgi:hypothetical protein
MRAFLCLPAAILACLLAGCTFDQQPDLSGASSTLTSYPPDAFSQTRDRFFEFAKRGDLGAMLLMTSPSTLKLYGEGRLRELYAVQVIPPMKTYPVMYQGEDRTAINADGITGWEYRNIFLTPDQKRYIKVQAIVVDIGGRYFVSSVTTW